MDSDIHVMEPPDLWQKYIDPEFKERAPMGLSEFVGDVRMLGPDGEHWGRAETAAPKRQRTGHTHARYQRQYQRFNDLGWTADLELGAMDEEGIDLAVAYPSRGLYTLAISGMDPPLAAALARSYNNWLYDFCQADPKRLVGAGMVSPFDIEDAVSEAHRCIKELGFKGIFLRPNEVNNRNWHDPYYDPLWSTLEELDVPVGFHEGVGGGLPHIGEQFGSNAMLRHVICHPGEQMLATISMCGGGVLARHPRLKVAFLEGNCCWLPFLLWRLDEHWETEGDVYAPDLTMPPSDYFRRQCFASVEPDEVPAKYVIDYMGNSCLVFSTDFPHNDSKFPYSVEQFLELPITSEDKRNILWDNCARCYGFK